ncbi:hypothetical protein V8G54_013247 [Vigna mungo]|uniref:Uncharacterized protein n=1 Tax=Vigna mungo TaxID=3915 RepID=A0AAQ3NVB9_VIGMU
MENDLSEVLYRLIDFLFVMVDVNLAKRQRKNENEILKEGGNGYLTVMMLQAVKILIKFAKIVGIHEYLLSVNCSSVMASGKSACPYFPLRFSACLEDLNVEVEPKVTLDLAVRIDITLVFMVKEHFIK